MIPRYAPTYTYGELINSITNTSYKEVHEALENYLKELYNKKYAFLFGRARVALYALLQAYNQPGGVVTPAYNCIVIPEAVIYAGYYPVFTDIDENTFNMTAKEIRSVMTADVTVVLITHQFGIPCDIDEIHRTLKNRHKILVVEDAAAAIGATYKGKLVGTFADAAIISFHNTKVISGWNGGALLTNDDELASRVRGLQPPKTNESGFVAFFKSLLWKAATSQWIYPAIRKGYQLTGKEKMLEHVEYHQNMPSGYFALLSCFTAALVLQQIEKLDENLARRRKIAEIYMAELNKSSAWKLPVIPRNCSSAWLQFPLLLNDKSAFYKYMRANGVDLSWTFRYSCADSFCLDGFPNTRKAADSVLGLPTYPSLSDDAARYICNVANKYSSSKALV